MADSKTEPKPNPHADALEEELSRLDKSQFPVIAELLENEIYRVRGNIADSVDLVENNKIKIRTKVTIPTDKYPNTNFVGKILGPKAQTLRAIQDTTKTRMSILGQGSMRNEAREKELLESGDSKYSHLKHKLHLQIDAYGPPTEAYYCMYMALTEAQRCFNTPDNPGDPTMGNSASPMGRGRGGMAGRGRGRGGMMSPPGSAPSQGYPPVDPNLSGGSVGGYTAYGIPDPNFSMEGDVNQIGGGYGQSPAWGKMPNQAARGRARGRGGHPYAKPGAPKN